MSSKATLARQPEARFYHPELDLLRFFAFFLVFLHHALPHESAFYTAMGAAPAVATLLAALGATGAYGVNLFFLLSSYLITELLLRERDRLGTVDLGSFYARRILRIWPLYFAFLAFAWAMQWWVPGQQIGWRAGLAFTLLGGNWWLVFVGFPSSVIFPLWSVSIEEQFYLLWPVTMRRLGRRGVLLAAVGMLAVANAARWYLALRHTWESRMWANTFVQLDAIAIGILLAVLLRGRSPQLAPVVRLALLLGGVTCLALAGNYFQIKGDPLTVPRVMFGYPTMILGASALFLAVLRADSQLAGNPLVYLGRISYGLYVFHVLGLMISDYSIPAHESSLSRFLLRDGFALVVTIVLASASYRWLETPFLRMKQRFTHVHSRPGG